MKGENYDKHFSKRGSVFKFLNSLEFSENELIVKSDITKYADFLKNYFLFTELESIYAISLKNGDFKLNYTLFSPENDERMILSTNIKPSVDSVQSLFENAKHYETKITNEYNIIFN